MTCVVERICRSPWQSPKQFDEVREPFALTKAVLRIEAPRERLGRHGVVQHQADASSRLGRMFHCFEKPAADTASSRRLHRIWFESAQILLAIGSLRPASTRASSVAHRYDDHVAAVARLLRTRGKNRCVFVRIRQHTWRRFAARDRTEDARTACTLHDSQPNAVARYRLPCGVRQFSGGRCVSMAFSMSRQARSIVFIRAVH